MIKIDFNKQNERRIIITGKTEIFRANVKDITHIVCDEYQSTMHLSDGTTYSTAHLLKHFEEILEEHGFFRVNRHTLINTDYIVSFKITYKERSVNVRGTIINVSKRRGAQLKKVICG